MFISSSVLYSVVLSSVSDCIISFLVCMCVYLCSIIAYDVYIYNYCIKCSIRIIRTHAEQCVDICINNQLQVYTALALHAHIHMR